MKDNNIDLDLLNKLSSNEKQIVEQILRQVSKNGNSNQLADLYYEDYEEIPVDLETFLSDRRYLGNYTNGGKDIYKTWKKELKFVHNPATFCDQWAITGCLDGSVKIPLLSGENIPIVELYNRHKNNPRNNGKDTIDYIYSYDLSQNKFTVGELTRVFFTGIKRVYEITLDNGRTVVCTADHPFLTKSKHWKTLNTGLNIGDSLLSFRREYNDGYEILLQQNNDKIQRQYTHRMVLDYKLGISEQNKKYRGHHKDNNPYNNIPSNLCGITDSQHRSYHAKKNWRENEYFRTRATENSSFKKATKEEQRERALKRWSKYSTKEERRKHLKEIGCKNFTVEFNKYNHPNLLKIDRDEFINYIKQCYSKWQVIEHFNISDGGYDSYCKRMNINPKNLYKPIKYNLPQNKYTRKNDNLLNQLNSIYTKFNKINLQIIEENYKLNKWERTTIQKWEDDNILEDLVKYYNHKIIKIKYIGERPTYDLTVRNHHNFALDCGVVSKNSTRHPVRVV